MNVWCCVGGTRTVTCVFVIRLKGVQNYRNTFILADPKYDMFVKMHLHVSDQFDLVSAVDLILPVKNRHI